jgi:hypothetical protein
MKILLTILCLTTALGAVPAEEKTAPSIELKQKSFFDAPDVRNPFWPIGWKKPNPKDPNAEAGPELSAASFSLSSVTMGAGARFAILNGKILQEGQQFGLQFGQQIYQVTLKAIQDGQVVIAYQTSEIVVPLRRK